MNPTTLVTMIICGIVIFGGLALVSRLLLRRRARPSGDFAGAPIGFGTVTNRRNTHRAIHQEYRWIIDFDVETPDGQRFPATAQVRILQGRQDSTLTVGSTVPVRYRPDRPGVVEPVFDQQDPATEAAVQAAWSAVQGRRPGNPG